MTPVAKPTSEKQTEVFKPKTEPAKKGIDAALDGIE